MSEGQDQGGRTGSLVVGVIMLVAGLWFIGGMGWERILPAFGPLQALVAEARSWFPGIALITFGVLLIVFGSRGGFHAHSPAAGTRLYRSRQTKMVAGVLGGIAEYFSMDVTLLRLAVVAAALLTDAGPFLVAYIVAAIVIQYPPEGAPVASQPMVTQAPIAPEPPAPPATPAPPAPPEG